MASVKDAIILRANSFNLINPTQTQYNITSNFQTPSCTSSLGRPGGVAYLL
jgi:hypothetical protein